jgi:hypothetical protein
LNEKLKPVSNRRKRKVGKVYSKYFETTGKLKKCEQINLPVEPIKTPEELKD